MFICMPEYMYLYVCICVYSLKYSLLRMSQSASPTKGMKRSASHSNFESLQTYTSNTGERAAVSSIPETGPIRRSASHSALEGSETQHARLLRKVSLAQDILPHRCLCIYIYIYIYICVCVYVYMYMYMCVYVYINVYVYKCVYM